MDVLTLSLGRNILEQGSRERARMHHYAQHLGALHVIVLTRKEHGYTNEVHEKNLHLYPTNSSIRITMLVDAFRTGRKIARQTRVDPLIISAQDPLEIGWLCWLLSWVKNTRLHIQVHGDYFSTGAWAGYSITRAIRRMGALVLLKRVKAIRVVSLRIKNSLVACCIDGEKITCLPIRPEIETFLDTPHVVRGVPPYTFLYVGRLAQEKDIPRILKAFSILHREYQDTKLRLVGDGEEKEKIESLIGSLGVSDAVVVQQWTNDVWNEMARADVFLLASKHEAYALTLIEALAVGLPVITTDVGCVGEVVLDDVHGIVVHDMGIQPYAEAMKKMIQNKNRWEDMSRQGRETAQHLARMTQDEYARAWVKAVSQAL